MNKYHFLLYLSAIWTLIASCAKKEEATPVNPVTRTEYTYEVPVQKQDGWEVGDLYGVRMNHIPIESMVRKIANPGGFTGIHSVVIIKNNRLVFEEYFGGQGPDIPHDMRSATKSITSILAGIAIDRRLLFLEDKVYSFFPEYGQIENLSAAKSEITIENLLTMRSGLHSNDWNSSSPGNEAYMYPKSDWIKFILDLPMINTPGTKYSYSTGGVVVLGGIIANATHLTIPEFSQQSLFGPLGISNYKWQHFPAGGTDTGGHLEMTSRDMAKIGQLFLNGGTWGEKRIISEAWVNKSISKHVTLSPSNGWGNGYGYLWWLSDLQEVSSYEANGNGGQIIQVIPEHDMVVVFTGGNYWPLDQSQVYSIMEQYILPAID